MISGKKRRKKNKSATGSNGTSGTKATVSATEPSVSHGQSHCAKHLLLRVFET